MNKGRNLVTKGKLEATKYSMGTEEKIRKLQEISYMRKKRKLVRVFKI